METRIETTERYESVFVDQFDDDVWLSVRADKGAAHGTLTKDQAKELIAALNRIVEAV
jgi:hypothetical protein